MRKLEKFLEEKANDISHSNSTMSRYFTIGKLTVRLSDHYSINSEEDIQIIYPVHDCYYYAVFIKGSTKNLIYNSKEVKEFVEHYCVIKELTSIDIPKDIKDNKVKFSIPYVKSKISVNYKNYKLTLKEGRQPWTLGEVKKLGSLLHEEFGTNKGFNNSFQTFIVGNYISYEQIISIYKYIVIDNDILKATTDDLQHALENIDYSNMLT